MNSEDPAHHIEDATTQSVKGSARFRQKNKARRNENAAGTTLPSQSTRWPPFLTGSLFSPEPMTPSCFHCCRSASVGKPLKTASSGIHITLDTAAAKMGSTRVTRESTKESERKRVQRCRNLVATDPMNTPTARKVHVQTSSHGRGHDSSAGHPGKNTLDWGFRLGDRLKSLVPSMPSRNAPPRAGNGRVGGSGQSQSRPRGGGAKRCRTGIKTRLEGMVLCCQEVRGIAYGLGS